MKNFIELTYGNGNKLVININNIALIESGNKTCIKMSTQNKNDKMGVFATILVEETYDQVKRLIKEAQKD